MFDFIKRCFQAESIRFVIVGVSNTIIGTAVMFIAYNVFGLGYWISSALNYIVGSIFSYFANKYFTFKSEKKSWKEIVRFVVNIAVCYGIAYGIAKPLINILLGQMGLPVSILEQISLVMGMCIFVVVNFCGQKFFVFK